MKLSRLTLIAVLLSIFAFAFASTSQAKPPGPTIVDVATTINEDTGEFSILLAAVAAADPAVAETLSGNGQFTVFAPTDEAFSDLLTELNLSAEELLNNQELVTEVLLYHVAHGRRYASDVIDSSQIRMLNGEFLLQDSGVLTDNQGRMSNIVATDVEAANGVIHVIDKVVLP